MNKAVNLKLIECPRDAMQGWTNMIPTQTKIDYINQLLQVGFDTIDFGSFVSAKAIPQLADTQEVLKGLKMDNSKSKLLAIIANTRGAEEAVQYDEITYLGFPFSISRLFLLYQVGSFLGCFDTFLTMHYLFGCPVILSDFLRCLCISWILPVRS